MRRNRIAVPGILLMGLVPEGVGAVPPAPLPPITCEMPGNPDDLAACLCELRQEVPFWPSVRCPEHY